MDMKKYNVIYADPPWEVKAGPPWSSNSKSRDLNYPTMTLDAIKNLKVKELSEKNSHLYLWTINKYIEQSYSVARSWGFTPSCLITWVKNPHGIGLGGAYIQTTEHLLFCRRGSLKSKKRIDSSWFLYKRGRHSQKPDEFRKMIEEVSGVGIELFAREKVRNWDVWGNEVISDVAL
jgi:N6-adenosine-specific RNA methylase IME4